MPFRVERQFVADDHVSESLAYGIVLIEDRFQEGSPDLTLQLVLPLVPCASEEPLTRFFVVKDVLAGPQFGQFLYAHSCICQGFVLSPRNTGFRRLADAKERHSNSKRMTKRTVKPTIASI